ncbi:cytochrome C551 [Chryseobacterium sp. CT-SW4]|uniref:cytochrome C551 n=1 Tax=Chryseobacterium sp. SW-1 TaxID=3157343 RepID=UPI003B0292D7
MKKLLIVSIGLGLFAISCGTKESGMTTDNKDSLNVSGSSSQTIPPMSTDSTRMSNPDSIKVKMDSLKSTQ